MTLATSFRSNNHGLQVGHNHGHITAQFLSTNHEIDRNCIRALGCPDSWAVKNRLKENKDKLLPQSIDWVHQDPQYKSWQDGDEVCLLWIKGGAGKGKTMISIGIIEELLRKESTIVTYFFCQNADYTLNTLEAIMKGLILQLVSQQTALMQSLRSRWDTINNRFDVDVNSWRTLWNIFLEMLEKSKCQRLFVIVDALDECQDDHHMADFLKLIVRNGLDHPAKIKWALTSRPLDHAESQLLAGHEQVRVSLELNSKFVSEAVKMYISSRAQELNILHRYGEALKREIQTELTNKAEGTFLWVSLVCKKLESVCREEALFTIQSLPPGLYPFYDQAFRQLSTQIGETANVRRCMRLLKVMMLAYRPLRLEEVDSVTALTCGEDAISALVHQCASFINLQDRSIAFVHQSARDWLAGEQSIFDTYDLFEHHDISLACLAYLSKWLKENFFELRRHDSTIESLKNVKNVERRALLASMDYAATFWAQHLEHAERTLIRSQITEKGVATIFLQENFLQWVECLGLLEKLPQATEALKALTKLAKNDDFVFPFVQDATRFLSRHYRTIMDWPMQIYSSAIIFSAESSLVKRANIEKCPAWIKNMPSMEDGWTSLIQTMIGHTNWVWCVTFSPDGKQVVSGSGDDTIKIWDATTSVLQQTLEGHSDVVRSVAFSPDGKQIVSGSKDKTVKLWDATTGDLQYTLRGHSSCVRSVAFSPDGKQIVSGSSDMTIKLWDAATGDLQYTLRGHFNWVRSVAFSPDGKRIASGSADLTIKIWDPTMGCLLQTLYGHSSYVDSVVFSPDGKRIASGSCDMVIKLWDASTGSLQQTLTDHPDKTQSTFISVAFSPDSKQIASGAKSGLIGIWDATTGNIQRTVGDRTRWSEGNWVTRDSALGFKIISLRSVNYRMSDWNFSVVFSPDGKHIASGTSAYTIKIWDTTTGDLQNTPPGHRNWVLVVAFCPNGKQITSIGQDSKVCLWDSTTGELLKMKAAKGIRRFLGGPSYIYRRSIAHVFRNPSRGIHKGDLKPIKGISVKNQWLCDEGIPFLRLPPNFTPTCHDVHANQIVFGLKDGRVMIFEIDRASLLSTLRDCSAPGRKSVKNLQGLEMNDTRN